MVHHALSAGLGAIVGLSGLAASQTTVWEVFGSTPIERLGRKVAGIGDVDHDGVADFAVGAYLADGNGADSGAVTVHSGATGALLYAFVGDAAGDWFGADLAAAGDVDGDGWPDVVVGAPRNDAGGTSGGQAKVFSGRDGSVLHVFVGAAGEQLGTAVSTAGDIDRDGHADLLVAEQYDEVHIYSGSTGGVLHTLVLPGFIGGVHGGGDVNRDGWPDLAIGVPWVYVGNTNRVDVFSGFDGSLLFTFPGQPVTYFGTAVRIIADVDADGHADVAVGAPRFSAGTLFPGYVTVVSGRTHAPLYVVAGSVGGGFGASIGQTGDLDGDGVSDLVVGEQLADGLAEGAGLAWTLSGATGRRLSVVQGPAAGDQLGTGVDGVGDLNGDGLPEVIVGAPKDDTVAPDAGAARVVDLFLDCNGNGVHDPVDVTSGASADEDGDGVPDECEFEAYCVAAPNSTGTAAQMLWNGSNSVAANDLQLVAFPLPPLVNGLFIYAAGPGYTPLGNGFLCLDPTVQGFVNRLPFETSNASGTMTHALDLTAPPVPESAITPGSTWYFSCWFRDPPAGGAGFNFSNGLSVLFQP